MCKFWTWFRLEHCGTITSVTRYGFRQILHADQKCDGFYVWCFANHKSEVYISDFRGLRIRIIVVLGSDHHIFQRIGTKFLTELKLSNFDFENETGNTNRIVEMRKFQFRFRLAHCGRITPVIRCGFSPNFARYSHAVSSTRVVL